MEQQPSHYCIYCKIKILSYLFQTHEITYFRCIKSNGYCKTNCYVSKIQLVLCIVGFFAGAYVAFYYYNEAKLMENYRNIYFHLKLVLVLCSVLEVCNTFVCNINRMEYMILLRKLTFLSCKLKTPYFLHSNCLIGNLKNIFRSGYRTCEVDINNLLLFVLTGYVLNLVFLFLFYYFASLLSDYVIYCLHLHFCWIILVEVNIIVNMIGALVQGIFKKLEGIIESEHRSALLTDVTRDYLNVYSSLMNLQKYINYLLPPFTILMILLCVCFGHTTVNLFLNFSTCSIEEILIWTFILVTACPIFFCLGSCLTKLDGLVRKVS